MDNVAALLDRLLGDASLKKLCLVVSLIIVILFLVGVYFFLHVPLSYFVQQLLLEDSEHIICIFLFCLISLFLSGLATRFFAKLFLGYFTEKNWFVAFNHAWDNACQARCIIHGCYVHIRSVENYHDSPTVVFYTSCPTCKVEKRLIHDSGQPIPLSNAQNIVKGKKEKWVAYNYVVWDKKNNHFYCKQCCSKLDDSDINNILCPYGCRNVYFREEIEKVRSTKPSNWKNWMIGLFR